MYRHELKLVYITVNTNKYTMYKPFIQEELKVQLFVNLLVLQGGRCKSYLPLYCGSISVTNSCNGLAKKSEQKRLTMCL